MPPLSLSDALAVVSLLVAAAWTIVQVVGRWGAAANKEAARLQHDAVQKDIALAQSDAKVARDRAHDAINQLTALKLEVEILKTTYVCKDDLHAFQQDMQHLLQTLGERLEKRFDDGIERLEARIGGRARGGV